MNTVQKVLKTFVVTLLTFANSNTAMRFPDNILKQIQTETSIQNLNTYLQPFKNCLVHLINYKGLDLKPLKFPVVLSRYVKIPANRTRKSSFNPEQDVHIYGNETLPFEYQNDPINRLKFQSESYTITYRSSSYNWRCFAQLYIFPPDEEYHFSVFFPEPFNNFWNGPNRKFM